MRRRNDHYLYKVKKITADAKTIMDKAIAQVKADPKNKGITQFGFVTEVNKKIAEMGFGNHMWLGELGTKQKNGTLKKHCVTCKDEFIVDAVTMKHGLDANFCHCRRCIIIAFCAEVLPPPELINSNDFLEFKKSDIGITLQTGVLEHIEALRESDKHPDDLWLLENVMQEYFGVDMGLTDGDDDDSP